MYYSFGKEINTHELIDELEERGKEVYLPYIIKEEKLLGIGRYSKDELDSGVFGIRKPARKEDIPVNWMDIIVVPGLLFAKNGYRIGYGGGYYDQLIKNIEDRIITIGFCFEGFLRDSLPIDEFDVPVKMIITEHRVLKIGGGEINLFEYNQARTERDKPLAYRMRPRNLDELFGQEHILGEGKLLYRAIKADRINSLILYGPPGTGKTSIAQVIANQTKADYVRLNAVTSGVKELREVIEQARDNLILHNKRTILFIDEIHRFNKAQQDALLPAVEEGIIILIGATTENPYFEVNSPLLSRSRIFRLNPLSEEDIIAILKRALTDSERGLGEYNVEISDKDLKLIASLSEGDARTALNALELAVLTTPPDQEGVIRINEEIIAESLQKKVLNYDKDGDNHYDVVSAFIKSMRGSDPDAALFWLARMLEAGEDPKFIARRVIVHAAEDVGLADPMALLVRWLRPGQLNL